MRHPSLADTAQSHSGESFSRMMQMMIMMMAMMMMMTTIRMMIMVMMVMMNLKYGITAEKYLKT